MNEPSLSPLRVWRLAVQSAAERHPPGEPLPNGQRAGLHGAAVLWDVSHPLSECPGDCQPLFPKSGHALQRIFTRQNSRRRWRWLNAAIGQTLEEMSRRDE